MNTENFVHVILWFLTAFFLAVVVQILIVYLLIENQFILKSVSVEVRQTCSHKNVEEVKP